MNIPAQIRKALGLWAIGAASKSPPTPVQLELFPSNTKQVVRYSNE